jgi:hypothetical protein
LHWESWPACPASNPSWRYLIGFSL